MKDAASAKNVVASFDTACPPPQLCHHQIVSLHKVQQQWEMIRKGGCQKWYKKWRPEIFFRPHTIMKWWASVTFYIRRARLVCGKVDPVTHFYIIILERDLSPIETHLEHQLHFLHRDTKKFARDLKYPNILWCDFKHSIFKPRGEIVSNHVCVLVLKPTQCKVSLNTMRL